MNWLKSAIERLEQEPLCGYSAEQAPASEPTALAALALVGEGKLSAARKAARWLAETQSEDGSVGVRRELPIPRWPTSLAILSWLAVGEGTKIFQSNVARAIEWTFSLTGETFEQPEIMGHNTLLAAWPWVEGTHSWIEPSALHVLALKAAGQNDHPRTREAVEVLLDRQLPEGGCNYGNTFVLGQKLRPHVQPSGVCLLGLIGEDDADAIQNTIHYLEGALPTTNASMSLSWGLLGLAAHIETPPDHSTWLEVAARSLGPHPSPHKLAMLVLASQGEDSLLITLPRTGVLNS